MSFYRSMRDGIIEAPAKAKAVAIPGFESHSFIAWREDDPAHDKEKDTAPAKVWLICEMTTGRSVDYGDTLHQAIRNASRVLSDYGSTDIAFKIANAPKMPITSTLFDGGS